MKILKYSILSLALFSTFSFSKNLVGLNINKTDLEIQSLIILNSYLNIDGSSAYVANINYIHTENNDLFNFGLGVYQSYDDIEGLLFGLGISNVYTSDFIAVPMFIHAMYVLPFFNYFPKTNLSAKILYAPEVLTFSEGSSYLEYRGEIDFDIINNMSVYGGYRNIEAEHNHPKFLNDYDSHDSFYGGLKYNF